MDQNIYDNPHFFEEYSKLNRSIHGLNGAPEWESIRALLPDLTGKRVLDLGCGFGWFARYAIEQGAARVLAIDVSQNMIAKAREDNASPAITYQIANLEELELPAASFDFAYSSLAFHYIKNFQRLLHTIHDALVPGSDLVFSIEHPIYMAPKNPEWIRDKHGDRVWSLNQYCIEGERTTDWLAKGVRKQHRTLGTTITTLIDVGFTIRHIEEWSPSPEQLQAYPEWAEHLDRPMFLLVAAQRDDM